MCIDYKQTVYWLLWTTEYPENLYFNDFVIGVLTASLSSTFYDCETWSEDEDLTLDNFSSYSEWESVVDVSNTATAQLPTSGPSGIVSNSSLLPKIDQNTPSAPAGPMWNDVTDNDFDYNHTIKIYSASSSPTLPQSFSVDTDFFEYFSLFFNDDNMEHICNEINMYDNKWQSANLSPKWRLRKWKDITQVNLNAFCGVFINVGPISLRCLEFYFTKAWDGHIP